MKKLVLLSMLTAAPLLGLVGTPASAGPSLATPAAGWQQSLVEKARSDCHWVDNKWTYQRGDKRLVCRPDRPSGQGWNWHREGNRFGWHHRGRNAWHNNSW
jgi:hypothetical protein